MEAKDTVISDVTPVTLLQNQRELYGLLREQAELSFKAGYEVAKEELAEVQILTFKDGKKAGIREVVEWVKTNDDSNVTCTIKLNPEDWQGQLEKWGIDDKAL